MRKRNRLHKNLYVGGSYYFVTICCSERRLLFVESVPSPTSIHEIFQLNWVGNIVKDTIEECSQLYEGVRIPRYVIMPNHLHLIIAIEDRSSRNLGQIVSAIKSISLRRIKKALNYVGGGADSTFLLNEYNTIWQKSFHDRIVRNEREYVVLEQYILDNPLKWEIDSLHPNSL